MGYLRRILHDRRPSPAMVVASIALLAALGGTSVAAVANVPDNSVGTARSRTSRYGAEDRRQRREFGEDRFVAVFC